MPVINLIEEQDVTLASLVATLQAVDNDSMELSPEEHLKLGSLIRNKVDGCAKFIKHLEGRIQAHRDFEKEHQESRKFLEAALQRFEDYVVYTMAQGQFEAMSGEEFTFKTRKSESVVCHRDPSKSDLDNMPEFVTEKVSYSWAKDAIKKAIKSGYPMAGFASIVEKQNLSTGVKK